MEDRRAAITICCGPVKIAEGMISLRGGGIEMCVWGGDGCQNGRVFNRSTEAQKNASVPEDEDGRHGEQHRHVGRHELREEDGQRLVG